MADLSEKHIDTGVAHVDEHDPTMDKGKIVSTRVVTGDEAYQQAMLKEPPIPWNAIALQLYACSIIGFFCSTSNGFDSSVFGSLTSQPAFLSFFAVGNLGIKAGIVSSMTQIGGVAAIPFIGPAIDTYGRRFGMFLGGLIIIIGVIIQASSATNHSTRQFMGGRFFMGMGVSIISSAGPCYTVEINHPAYRGTVVALYNVFW